MGSQHADPPIVFRPNFGFRMQLIDKRPVAPSYGLVIAMFACQPCDREFVSQFASFQKRRQSRRYFRKTRSGTFVCFSFFKQDNLQNSFEGAFGDVARR